VTPGQASSNWIRVAAAAEVRVYRVEDSPRRVARSPSRSKSCPADQISMAKLLTLLFGVTALLDMTTRAELVSMWSTT
jgi:hypothetical protein